MTISFPSSWKMTVANRELQFLTKLLCWCGHDSSVGIETVLWIGRPTGAGNFSFPQNSQTKCGSHPASYLAFTGGSIPGGKAALV